MAAPEQRFSPHLPEAPATDPDGQQADASTSAQMERVVTQLAAAYAVDLSQQGANLSLDMPDRPDRWMIANLDGQRLSLTCCFVDEDGGLMPDLDLVFTLSPAGWEPVEIAHAPAVWQDYAKATQAAEQPVRDTHGDFDFVSFSDYIAAELEAARLAGAGAPDR